MKTNLLGTKKPERQHHTQLPSYPASFNDLLRQPEQVCVCEEKTGKKTCWNYLLMKALTERVNLTDERVSLNIQKEYLQSESQYKFKQKNQFGFMHEIRALTEK